MQKSKIQMKNSLKNETGLIFTDINMMTYYNIKKTIHNR